jgi:predicted CXXCH cytochrome family protein
VSDERHDVGTPQSPAADGSDLQRWVTAGVVATAVIVLSLPLYLVKERLAGTERGAGEAAPAAFVGREQCSSCHEQAYEAWRGSDHDRAMTVASDTTVRGDFDDAVFVYRGDTTRFYRRDGKYHVYAEGPDGMVTEFEITHTFGWEPLQQYLVPFPGGRLQALSVAWDTERDEWFFLYPGRDIPADDWLHWTRGAQNWNGMCAECHSTNLIKGYDAETKTFGTTWSEIDVSCEACHGPGSRHVAWAELPPMARPDVEHYDLVVPTGDITSEAQVALCAPCHSRRTELGDYDHRSAELLDHALPAVLREGLYHADGQILEEVYVYGSFVQSKMYRNGVRCSDCHDAHSLQLREEGNALCTQCHRADTYDSYDHHFHQEVYQGEPSDGALCVKCHMVEQPYMVVDWRADHSLRLPRPDLSRETGVPNACTASGCHDDQPLAWSLRYYTQWYGEAKRPHFGQVFAAARAGRAEAQERLIRMAADPLYPAIVRATALDYLSGYPGEESTEAFNLGLQDEDPLIRYTALNSASAPTPERYVELVAPLLFDPVRAVRIEAAMRLADAPAAMLQPYQQAQRATALEEYERTMVYSLDFAFAGHNLGNLYGRLGDVARAERYYRTAVEIDDLFYPAKSNLAVLLNAQGRNDEAELLLRELVEDYPEQYEAAYSLGLLLAEMERVDEAVEFLGRASAGMPERARAHYNYGLALQAVGRVGEAEAALRRALDVEPENIDFLFALADHYVKRGELRRALTLADRMIALEPDNPIGRQVKQYVEGQLAGRGRR